MKAPPQSTKNSLSARLNNHVRARWPELAGVDLRFRSNFAYIDGRFPDGAAIKLCRLRYGGSAHLWGFAIYRASHDDYKDSFLPTGTPIGTAEEALDCACGLYLNVPSPRPPNTPTN